MKASIKYRPLDSAVMRIPYYPWAEVDNKLISKTSLEEVMEDDVFQNSLLISAPTLLTEIKRYLDGNIKKEEKTEGILAAVAKYVSRMSTRCTPFASLASCMSLSFNNLHNILLDDKLIEDYNIDYTYQNMLLRKIESATDYRSEFSYKSNDSIYKVGKDYRYITCDITTNGTRYNIRNIKRNSILTLILDYTTEQKPFRVIVEHLISNFELSRQDAEKYINGLIDAQLLISNISPTIVGDGRTSVTSTINVSESAPARALIGIYGVLSKLSINNYHTLNEEIAKHIEEYLNECKITSNRKYLIQLDTYRAAKEATLSKSLQRTLQQAFKFLCRLSTGSINNNLADFTRRYVARYQDAEMPLLEVLDPNIGIGYTVRNDILPNPLIAGLNIQVGNMSNNIAICPLFRLLLKKVFNFNPNENNCIELTDDDVKDFVSVENNLPLSLAAVFSITEYDATKDEYKLGGIHFCGSSAGNLLGRFASGDDGICRMVKEITSHEQSLCGDSIVAEIVHLPESRTGNILHRPHIRDYEITYNTRSTLVDSHVIPSNDLYVKIINGRIHLRSKRLDKEVVARLTTAHNYSRNSTPLYQFLCDLQSQGSVPALSFFWCGLESIFDYLPRVQYKNMVLSPAKWRIKTDAIEFKAKKLDLDKVEFWRKDNNLPKEFLLIAGDNKLWVNTQLEYSVKAMLSEIGGKQVIDIEEFIPCKEVVKDRNGKCYMNECIVPFIKNE